MATDGRTDVRARPDASMSMLNDLFDHRVEDDYLAARRLRGSPHAARPRLPSVLARRVAFFLVVVVCAVFATSGVRQLLRPDPQQSADHEALVEEAQQRSGDVDALERQLVRARTEYAVAQRAALAKDAQGVAHMHRLQALQDSTGFNAVHGPGVVVTVDDAQGGGVTRDASGGRILDRDLQILVNGLWAAGATAVAINGQRLTTLTAIREAGDAVLVDYRPLARPYVVSALGDRHTLAARFADGSAGRYFKTLQTSFEVRFEMDDQDALTLPAASTVTLQYAHKEKQP